VKGGKKCEKSVTGVMM
jgi:hypothetical protein